MGNKTYFLAKKVWSAYQRGLSEGFHKMIMPVDSKEELLSYINDSTGEKLRGVSALFVNGKEATKEDWAEVRQHRTEDWEISEGYEPHGAGTEEAPIMCIFMSPMLAAIRAVNLRERGMGSYEIIEVTSPESVADKVVRDTDSDEQRKLKFHSICFPAGVAVNDDRQALFSPDDELLFTQFPITESEKRSYLVTAQLPDTFIDEINKASSDYLTKMKEYNDWNMENLKEKGEELFAQFKKVSATFAEEEIAGKVSNAITL